MKRTIEVEILDNPRRKRRRVKQKAKGSRRLTPYQKHVQKELKAGKTMKQAARSWRGRRRKKVKRTRGRYLPPESKYTRLKGSRPRDKFGRFKKGATGAAGWRRVERKIHKAKRGRAKGKTIVYKVAGMKFTRTELKGFAKVIAGGIAADRIIPFIEEQLTTFGFPMAGGGAIVLALLAAVFGKKQPKFRDICIGALAVSGANMVKNVELFKTSGISEILTRRALPQYSRSTQIVSPRALGYNATYMPLPDIVPTRRIG